jgi:alkanesulfonate monooxygenase SsuD/methylene tetrahydromethanopterin reductase-like flavin-dependent oxidoreductase (luciferase family)
MKARASRYGRDPDGIVIMPGLLVTVGSSEEEAQQKYDRLQNLIDPKVGLDILSAFIGFDLSGYPVDGPLPQLPDNLLTQSRSVLFAEMAHRENLTIRQLYMKIAGGRGHAQIVGTASQIADLMEAWFRGGAADGFNVLPSVLPSALDDFVDLVVPELRKRGLFRTEYEGRTLRDRLGVPRPKSRNAVAPVS